MSITDALLLTKVTDMSTMKSETMADIIIERNKLKEENRKLHKIINEDGWKTIAARLATASERYLSYFHDSPSNSECRAAIDAYKVLAKDNP